jgi:hypothetical protein
MLLQFGSFIGDTPSMMHNNVNFCFWDFKDKEKKIGGGGGRGGGNFGF